MINRTMVRTKVVQTLFAYYNSGEGGQLQAKKELLKSFDDTYSLYMIMLDLVNEMVSIAEEKEEYEAERAKVTHRTHEAATNFINNKFAQQVFNNRHLRAYLDERHLGWDAAHESLKLIWKDINESKAYKEYMTLEHPTYDDDKQLWRKLVTDVFADSAVLESALEELEIGTDHRNWTTDINQVLSYIVKTIKRFSEKNGQNQPLLEMFDSEEELDFAKKLLKQSIDGAEEYRALVERHLKNWDISRVAYIDLIIMQTALAEVTGFPDIPLQVSLNEYLEIAKEYSTEKSHQFINGVLDESIRELKAENKLLKAVQID